MVGPCRFIVAALACVTVIGCGVLAPQAETNLLGQAAATQDADASPQATPAMNSVSVMAPSAAVLSALGGKVIAQPRVQLISFNNDSDAASVQNFLLAWSQSGAWQQVPRVPRATFGEVINSTAATGGYHAP